MSDLKDIKINNSEYVTTYKLGSGSFGEIYLCLKTKT